MKQKTADITLAAVIGALYASLTLLGGVFGISYGAVQFRFSEALCVLPLFTKAAVPGLTVGCLAADIFGVNGPLDAVMGTLATLLSAVITRGLRHTRVGKFPLLSFLSPVAVNGILVGAEITLLSSEKTALSVFAVNMLTVMAGEAAVMLVLGVPLYVLISKTPQLKKILRSSDTRG